MPCEHTRAGAKALFDFELLPHILSRGAIRPDADAVRSRPAYTENSVEGVDCSTFTPGLSWDLLVGA